MDYKLSVVRVFVRDWERAVRFYSGPLGMQSTFSSHDMGWAQFDTGGSQLAIERADPDDTETAELVGRYVGVSLQVSDIDATYKTLLDRGVEFLGPPEMQPWGGTLAHFRDPEDNVLTLLGSGDAG